MSAPAPPPANLKEKYMKMRESIRRSCFVAIVALLSFGPTAFAQTRVASRVSVPSFTSNVGAVVFSPFREDWDRKKRKKVAASEGGSAALYVMFAGLACGSALLLRSRRTAKTVEAKSV